MRFTTALLATLPVLAAAAPVVSIEADALSVLAEKRAIGGTTASDVDNGICRPVTFIFARGSFEPGNVGIIIGPPLITALNTAYGATKVASQGVNYKANLGGNFLQSGNNPGIPLMVAEIQKAISQCPSTQIAIGGYSQGGLVVHGTLAKLGAQISYIKAVVLFGDEGAKQPITAVPASSVDSFCASGDDICEKDNFVITKAHLSYGSDAGAAAAFIKSKISI